MKETILDLTSFLEDCGGDHAVTSTNASGDNNNNNNQEMNKQEVTAKLFLKCHCILGEGIIYDDRTNSIYWTNIDKCEFHVIQFQEVPQQQPNDGTSKYVGIHQIHIVPKMLGSFGLIEQQLSFEQSKNDNNDDEEERNTSESTVQSSLTFKSLPLLCAWEDGFQLYDVVRSEALSNVSVGEDVNPLSLPSRLNDGRVDRFGKYFVCGGYYGDVPDRTMKVYQVRQQQQQNQLSDQVDKSSNTGSVTVDGIESSSFLLVHEPIVDEFQVTNSICWSLDGTTMYLANSPTKQICSYRYDTESGKISQKSVFHTKTTGSFTTTTTGTSTDTKFVVSGVPDGSCVDSDGYIWNAVWKNGLESSYVQRIHPNSGEVVYTVHIPYQTSAITCCCFGRIIPGTPLNILFITSSQHHTTPEKEPYAGCVFAVQVPFTGCFENKLQFKIEKNEKQNKTKKYIKKRNTLICGLNIEK